jgi:hypothetical protein
MTNLDDHSNEQLWAVVYDRMLPSQSQRLHDLSEKNKWVELTVVEEVELDQLIDLADDNMLLRSEALVLLKQRGEDVDTYLKSGSK